MVNCLIIDSEPLMKNSISECLSKLNGFNIIQELNNAVDAFEYFDKYQIDLIFLEINKSIISGIELIRTIDNKPSIIITSSNPDYAFDAFEFDAIDFLLKPFSFERFLKSIYKFKLKYNRPAYIIDNAKHGSNKTIHIKEGKKTHSYKADEIILIESMRDYTKIHTNESNLIIKATLHRFEELLPDESFIRIHKSFIISIDKVKAYSPTFVMINNKRIPIGKIYKNEAIKRLNMMGVLI